MGSGQSLQERTGAAEDPYRCVFIDILRGKRISKIGASITEYVRNLCG
jgi:hypothetical protein